MKKFFTYTIALVFLASAMFVFAAGGGGGGGVPTCTQDQWDCTGWSQCGSNGIQTRVCRLTFDCHAANDQKPAESQSCTPPAPPPPAQTTTPNPTLSPPPPSALVCTRDTYTCGDWRGICDASGREYRTCTLSNDCPSAQTPPPVSSRVCQVLQCGNETTLRERILCRLNLTPAGLTRELEIQYLPEACRIEEGEERHECIDRYKSLQPCWNVAEGEQRFTCARNVLKLGPLVSDEVKNCQGKTGAEQASCKHEVKEKVISMTIFRFYDLETRAESLVERGANVNTIADFETTVELKKQEFYKATSNAERMKIILDVRRAWQDFINSIKDEVQFS